MIDARRLREVARAVGPLVATVVVGLNAVAKPYEIPTGSMLPTIQLHDRVIANRVVYLLREPERGDVIVFQPGPDARRSCDPTQTQSDVPFVKRVIGVPGDRVAVRENVAYVNGTRFEVPAARLEPLGQEANYPAGAEAAPVVVPDGALFVLGDNRGSSCDSRFWRAGGEAGGAPAPFVDRDAVIGQAEVTYWPPRHIGFLR